MELLKKEINEFKKTIPFASNQYREFLANEKRTNIFNMLAARRFEIFEQYQKELF